MVYNAWLVTIGCTVHYLTQCIGSTIFGLTDLTIRLDSSSKWQTVHFIVGRSQTLSTLMLAADACMPC